MTSDSNTSVSGERRTTRPLSLSRPARSATHAAALRGVRRGRPKTPASPFRYSRSSRIWVAERFKFCAEGSVRKVARHSLDAALPRRGPREVVREVEPKQFLIDVAGNLRCHESSTLIEQIGSGNTTLPERKRVPKYYRGAESSRAGRTDPASGSIATSPVSSFTSVISCATSGLARTPPR